MNSDALAYCSRCHSVIDSRDDQSLQDTIALAFAGVILLVITHLYPIVEMQVKLGTQSMNLLSSARYFWVEEMYFLAALIVFTCLIVPTLQLFLLLYLLIPIKYGEPLRDAAPVLRFVQAIVPWGMLEVLFVGLLISMIKLTKLATLEYGVAFWSCIGLVGVILTISARFHPQEVWRRISLRQPWTPPRISAPLLVCRACALISSPPPAPPHRRGRWIRRDPRPPRCPRCGARLYERQLRSLQRSTALALAAIILYIPANLVPITKSIMLGAEQSDTIMSGVIFFFRSGSWHIALVILLASVVIPLIKLLILLYLIISVRYPVQLSAERRTHLYHWIEVVGRWSMVDIYVVGVLISLVRLPPLASIEARPGAIYFAGVVILTIIATEMFDPRLMWVREEVKSS